MKNLLLLILTIMLTLVGCQKDAIAELQSDIDFLRVVDQSNYALINDLSAAQSELAAVVDDANASIAANAEAIAANLATIASNYAELTEADIENLASITAELEKVQLDLSEAIEAEVTALNSQLEEYKADLLVAIAIGDTNTAADLTAAIEATEAELRAADQSNAAAAASLVANAILEANQNLSAAVTELEGADNTLGALASQVEDNATAIAGLSAAVAQNILAIAENKAAIDALTATDVSYDPTTGELTITYGDGSSYSTEDLRGADGQNGSQGAQGLIGSIGPTGATGPMGPAGPQGIPGLQGLQGIAGDTGIQGIQGAVGSQGQQGAQGETGSTGATGAQGVPGLQGIPGITPSVELFLTQVTSGTTVIGHTVRIVIDGVSYTFDVLDGQDGADGNDGAQGIQGIAGEDGIDGINFDSSKLTFSYDDATGILSISYDGTVIGTTEDLRGNDGTPGATGLTGATGAQGLTGAAGTNGNDGAAGSNGVNGNDGVDGLSAYDLWLAAGNTGTVEEFLSSLVGPQGQQGPAGGDEADTWASNNTTTGGDVINERDGSFDNGEAAALAANAGNTTDATFATVTSQERLFDTTDIYDVEVLTVNGDVDDVNFPDGTTRQGALISAGLTDQVGEPIVGSGFVANPNYTAVNGPDVWNVTGTYGGEESNSVITYNEAPSDPSVATYTKIGTETYDVAAAGNVETLTVVDAQDDPAFADGATRQVETSAAQIGLTREDSNEVVANPNFVADEADEIIATAGAAVITGGEETTAYGSPVTTYVTGGVSYSTLAEAQATAAAGTTITIIVRTTRSTTINTSAVKSSVTTSYHVQVNVREDNPPLSAPADTTVSNVTTPASSVAGADDVSDSSTTYNAPDAGFTSVTGSISYSTNVFSALLQDSNGAATSGLNFTWSHSGPPTGKTLSISFDASEAGTFYIETAESLTHELSGQYVYFQVDVAADGSTTVTKL